MTDERGPGRPRPEDVVQRDKAVLDMLSNGRKTRNEIAFALDERPYLVYLSLDRLRSAGLVRKVDISGFRHFWTQESP